jgi:hypothetical protein
MLVGGGGGGNEQQKETDARKKVVFHCAHHKVPEADVSLQLLPFLTSALHTSRIHTTAALPPGNEPAILSEMEAVRALQPGWKFQEEKPLCLKTSIKRHTAETSTHNPRRVRGPQFGKKLS